MGPFLQDYGGIVSDPDDGMPEAVRNDPGIIRDRMVSGLENDPGPISFRRIPWVVNESKS